MFTKPPVTIICEDCYFAHHYGDASFTKKPKHCVLDAIDAPMSQRLCLCRDVVRVDSQGRMRNLFPIAAGDNHLDVAGGLKCMLLRLGDLVTRAKYEGLLAVARPAQTQTKRSLSQRLSIRGRGRERERQPSRQTPAPTDADIAQLLKEIEEKHPVQRSTVLRVGTVLVEIDHGRIVISPREPAVFRERLPVPGRRCLAIAADSTLSQQQRPAPPKRTLAVLKQVVGAPFTGLDDSSLEGEIVNLIVTASETDSPSEDAIQNILDTLHTLLTPRVKTYLASLTSRLIHTPPSTSSSLSTLIDTSLFTPLIPTTNTEPPLYLISFLSYPSSPRPTPRTKHDIPPGLIEEYLHAPLHRTTDFLDASTEYWIDWVAPVSANSIFPLFPWDCTETFNPATPRCGSCTLSRHLWAYPLDAWSTVSHHLTRPRWLYPPRSNSDSKDTDWSVNRRTLLSASHTLVRVALAMARSPRVRAATEWLAAPQRELEQIAPYVRTGGIHRARPPRQPVLLSPWASLAPVLQREQYARVRDEMVRRVDMGASFGEDSNVYAGQMWVNTTTAATTATATAATAMGVGVGVGLGAGTATTDAQIGVVWCEFDGTGGSGATVGTFASAPANCGSTGCGSSAACGVCSGGGGDGGGGGGCGGGCGGGSGGGGGGGSGGC